MPVLANLELLRCSCTSDSFTICNQKRYQNSFDFVSDLIMDTRRRQCENKPDALCYIHGCFTLIRQRGKITDFVRRVYKTYFGLALGD